MNNKKELIDKDLEKVAGGSLPKKDDSIYEHALYMNQQNHKLFVFVIKLLVDDRVIYRDLEHVSNGVYRMIGDKKIVSTTDFKQQFYTRNPRFDLDVLPR